MFDRAFCDEIRQFQKYFIKIYVDRINLDKQLDNLKQEVVFAEKLLAHNQSKLKKAKKYLRLCYKALYDKNLVNISYLIGAKVKVQSLKKTVQSSYEKLNECQINLSICESDIQSNLLLDEKMSNQLNIFCEKNSINSKHHFYSIIEQINQ